MRTYEPRGIESSPPREASPTTEQTICPDEERRAEIDLALSELIERMESTDWADIPGISTAEAAAWNARLVEARDDVQAAGQSAGGAE